MRKQLQVVLVGLLLLQAIFFPAFFPSVSAVSAASGGMSNDGAAGARLKTGIAENTLTILNTSHIKRTGTSQDSDASSSDDAFGAHGASGDNGAPGADDISSTNDTSAGDGAPSAGETSGDGGVLTLSLDALLSVTSPDKELPELSISGNFTPLPIPASDEDAEISGDIVNAADGKIGTWRILPRDAVGESQSSGESYSDEKSHVVALSLSSIKIGAKKIHLDITGTYDAGSESGAASGTAGMPVRVTVSGGAFVDIDVPSDSATNESATNEGSAGAQSATSQTSEEGIALQDAADNNNAKDGRKSGSITIARAAMDVADLFALYAPADRFADNVDVTYTPDNPVTVTSTVNVNFPFSIPPEVQAMMQNGDYADMPMPSGLKVTALQSGTLEDGPTTYGSYTIDPATNTMHIVFTNPGAVPPEGGFINYNVHFDTAIIQTPGEKVFYFPTKTQLPPFSVVVHPTVASSISKAGHSDAVTNPQNITWNVDFNRDYQTLTNAAIAEAFPAEVTFASVAVYPLTLDLNGNVQSVGAAPLTAGTDYTVDAGGNISFLRTISQPYRLVYQTRINDDAKPQAGGTLNAHNEATLSSDTTTPITAAATVALTYGKMLAKSETYYHTKTQTYDWSIQYNYGQKTIPTGVAIIDTLSNNMALFDSNNAPSQSPVLSPGGVPTLYYMNFNAAGTAVKGDPVPADAYTIVTTDAALHGFSVTFNDNIRQNSAIGIYYTTQVTDVVHDNTSTTVTNNVSQSGVQQPPPISKKPQQKMVIKDTPTINRGAKIAHWTLTLNYNNYRITNAAFTDTMNGTALGYISLPYAVSDGDPSTIPDMPKVSLKTTGGQTLTQGTDYELIVTTSGAIGYDSFTIKLIGAYADTTAAFDLSYYTQYNITAIAPGPKYTYTNNMTATWNTDGHPYTATGTSSFSDSQEEADQSMKSGSYNPLTKEITWTMVVNYNDITTGAIAVLDTFHGDQVYVPGSLEIYRGHISSTSGIFVRASSGSSSGSPSTQYSVNQTAYAGGGTDAANYIALGTTLGDESTLSASDIATTGSAADGTRESQFVISIGKGSGSTVTTSIPGIYDPGFIPMVFQIIYKTSLADTVITGAAAYQNDLQTGIVAATPYYSSISALVSVAYGGEEVAKTGAYSAATNQVNWSLWINRSQSTLLDAKLVDDPSTNQTLLPGSFKVYEGNVAADGTVTTGAAVAASKYTVTITTNPSTGQQEFTVDFGNITSSGAISKPYLVTYSTTPNFTSQTETVNNTAQIYSTGGALVGPPATHSETVKLESSSGIAWGKKGSLTINKTNPSYGAIEGAVFQLIRHWTIANPPADQVISTGTTDAAGNLTFGNLIYSPSNSSFIYILKETSTPNGYTIPDALVSGVQVTVNDNSTNGTVVTALRNDFIKLHVDKVTMKGVKLANSSFRLNYWENNTWVAMNNFQVMQSTTNGFDITGTDTTGLLLDGRYQLIEFSATPGYQTNDAPINFDVVKQPNGQRAIIVGGTATTSTAVTNYQTNVRMQKTNADGTGLNGAVFQLQIQDDNGTISDNGTTYSAVKSITSAAVGGTPGVVAANDLGPGNYRFVETKAPGGYYPNTSPVAFSIPAFAESTPPALVLPAVVNYKGMAQFIKKEGIVTEEAIGGSPDQTTTVAIENPSGSAISGAAFAVLFGEGSNAGRPIDQNGNLATTSSAVAYYYSDANGIVRVPNLSPGVAYQLIEVAPPAGYIQNNETIQFRMPAAITDDPSGAAIFGPDQIQGPDGLIVYNRTKAVLNFLGSSQFTKHGRRGLDDDKSEVAVAGAVYALYRITSAGISVDPPEPVTGSAYGAGDDGYFTTNMLGAITTSDKLEPGGYEFIEIQAPPGYILDPTPFRFTIGATEPNRPEDIDLGDKVNYKGAAAFGKSDVAGAPLGGAGFDVVRLPDANVPGVVQTVEHVTSDAIGNVYADGLAPGNYEFRETATKNGAYIINTTPIPFTIPDKADGKPAVVQALGGATGSGNASGAAVSFVNYLGKAQLVKVTVGGAPLTGATFKVVDQAGRTIAGNGNLAADENGRVFAENLPPGRYSFIETEAPDGYILNSSPVAFTIPQSAAGAPETVTVNESGTLKQINYKGEALLKKVSSKSKKKTLRGAVFELQDGYGEVVRTGLKTGKDGTIHVTDLAPGRYAFVETKAPKGYVLNDKPVSFTVPATAKGAPSVITISKKNTPVSKTSGGGGSGGEGGPGTGDNAPLVSLSIIAAAALIGLIAAAARYRRIGRRTESRVR